MTKPAHMKSSRSNSSRLQPWSNLSYRKVQGQEANMLTRCVSILFKDVQNTRPYKLAGSNLVQLLS